MDGQSSADASTMEVAVAVLLLLLLLLQPQLQPTTAASTSSCLLNGHGPLHCTRGRCSRAAAPHLPPLNGQHTAACG